MTRRIAALSCCLSLAPGSPAAAEDILRIAVTPAAVLVTNDIRHDGPLRRASNRNDNWPIADSETSRSARETQDSCGSRGSWMERHPVWSGALVGFGTGVALTYAVAHNEKDELIQVITPGAAAPFWGGVSAGVGALAGWGIGRNRDDCTK